MNSFFNIRKIWEALTWSEARDILADYPWLFWSLWRHFLGNMPRDVRGRLAHGRTGRKMSTGWVPREVLNSERALEFRILLWQNDSAWSCSPVTLYLHPTRLCGTALLAFQWGNTCPKYCFEIRALQTEFVSFPQWESSEVQWGLRVSFPWFVLPTFCKRWVNIFFLRTKQYSCLSIEIGHWQETGPPRRCWGSKVDRPGTGSTFINTT